MHLVYVDAARNRLHQILAGTLDAAAASALLVDLNRALQEIRPGYEILSDLRELEGVDESAETAVREMMERCGARHPSLLVRVLREPSANFGFTIMSYFHYPRGTPVVTCSSLQEAMRHLARDPAPHASASHEPATAHH